MKHLSHALLATAAISMASCAGNSGYTVTGSFENCADGDTILLQEYKGNNEFATLNSTTVKNGKFTLTGAQDSTIYCALTSIKNGEPTQKIPFYLENGKINVNVTAKNETTVSGTVCNDAFQNINNEKEAINAKAEVIAKVLYNSETDEATRNAKKEEMMQLQKEYEQMLENNMFKNLNNIVGVSIFKQSFYNNSTEKNDSILQLIPAQFQNDEQIVHIKEFIQKQKATAPGQKFVDFSMNDPEGNPVKLSDYVGKGKVVLIDFWASWCGPCRQEMPNIVEAYKQYKGKNFEIVGVSLDRDAESWKKAITDLNITWPQMSDLKFWQCEGAQIYAVNSIPHTILVDADGTILARGLHGEELLTKIAETLK